MTPITRILSFLGWPLTALIHAALFFLERLAVFALVLADGLLFRPLYRAQQRRPR